MDTVLAMRKRLRVALWLSFLCALLLGHPAHARAEQSFIFASVADGRRILTAKDSFIQRMSPFDRSARMKTKRAISESEYLAFVGENVLEWNSDERIKVQSALRQINPALSQLFPALREAVYLIKTTGDEEAGNSTYTRGYAIVLPKGALAAGQSLSRLLAHEFFHIVSRNYPKFRDILYETIGFQRCGEVEFPVMLDSPKITNPDAPINDHCIRVGVAGEMVWVMPVLYSSAREYDIVRGGEFLKYLVSALMVVERAGASGTARPILDAGRPKLVEVNQVSNFFEQVGRNTRYIISPEEILADNVALLVLGERSVPSPQVLKKIAEALGQARAAEPSPAQDAPIPTRP